MSERPQAAPSFGVLMTAFFGPVFGLFYSFNRPLFLYFIPGILIPLLACFILADFNFHFLSFIFIV